MQNEVIARELRQQFQDVGIFVVSLIGSAGVGKTALLEHTLARLSEKYQVAALVGSLANHGDAAGPSRASAPVRQIATGSVGRLDAETVRAALDGWMPHPLDFLFIENTGNLDGAVANDLGEDLRIVLMSVLEGEDTPLKYPAIFSACDLAMIIKTDLSETAEFNPVAAIKNIQAVRPDVNVMQISANTGVGFEEWIDLLIARYEQEKAECDHPSDVALNDPSVKVVDANWVRHL